MRTLRKIAAFGLCLLLFAALLWGIFPRQLGEAAANLFAGGGLGTYFLPTEGEDGALYLLHTQRGRGNTLVGLRQGRMLFDGPAQTVFTEENLSALYHLPLCVFAHPRNGLPQALPACPRGPHHAGEGESPPPPPAPAPEAAVPDAEPRPVDPADPARRS